MGCALLGAACGSNEPELPPDLADAIARSGSGSADYPAAPYGTSEGETARNLCFDEVWRNPEASGFDPAVLERVCFADFYDPDGSRGVEILLVNTGALWCLACRTEWGGAGAQTSLLEKYDERQSQGFRILGLFFQGVAGEPASREDITLWAKTYAIDVPFGRDPEFLMGLYADEQVQPFNMLVDASNMKILRAFEGDQSAALFSVLDAELEKRRSQ